MSVSQSVMTLGLAVTDQVATGNGYANATRNTATYDGGSVTETLKSSTTPPVTTQGVGSQAMTSGSGTIDMTSLTGLNGVTVSLSGITPRHVLFDNPATNANPITIAVGGSNGYTGLGSSFSLTLQPGQKALLRLGTGATAVSGTNKTFSLTGTGPQALNYQIVAG